MTKVIDNSWVEGASYVEEMSLLRAKRWSFPNGVKAYIPAIGISDDFDIGMSMIVDVTVDGDVTATATGSYEDAEYIWMMITDGEGHFVHGESATPATPTDIVLDISTLNAQKDWTVIVRAKKVGDERDAVILWTIANPATDPTVVIPVTYYE